MTNENKLPFEVDCVFNDTEYVSYLARKGIDIPYSPIPDNAYGSCQVMQNSVDGSISLLFRLRGPITDIYDVHTSVMSMSIFAWHNVCPTASHQDEAMLVPLIVQRALRSVSESIVRDAVRHQDAKKGRT